MKLLFPGSFDPFTIGHANLVERGLKIADDIVIAIGINDSKQPRFTVAQRVEAIRSYYISNPHVSVIEYSGLTVDAVRQTGAHAILRGVRSAMDYDMESNLACVNRAVDGVETLLLTAQADVQHISSSMIRELIRFGRDTEGLMIDTFKQFI